MTADVTGRNPIAKRFSEVVQRRRNAADLTQEKLAEAAGVDASTIARLESGKRGPSLATIQGLARALQTTMYELLWEVEEGSPQAPRRPRRRASSKAVSRRTSRRRRRRSRRS